MHLGPRARHPARSLWWTWAAIGLLIVVGTNACRGAAPDPSRRLSDLWTAYQRHYVSDAGAVRDPQRSGHVTSEAQSYAMLQAALLGDRPAFERVWSWTREHLARPDGLHVWLWDPTTARALDQNSATDADQDIALALILAARAFDRADYLDEARRVVRGIRASAAVPVPGSNGWFPVAGNWAREERIVNLSYFAPYAYRYFDRLDPEGQWPAAIETGYELLAGLVRNIAPLLSPDFATLSADGRLGGLPERSTLSREFSYDGIRLVWRLDVDCRVHREPRACDVAGGFAERLERLRERDGHFVTRYNPAGQALTAERSPSFEAAFLPTYTRRFPEIAAQWRQTALSDRVIAEVAASGTRYYDANWIWFGLAAADGWLERRLPPADAMFDRSVR